MPLEAILTGSGEMVSWIISPSMPDGLSFDTATGEISGTPAQLLDRTMFTITATNTGGSATTYINITINDEIPTIVYTPDDVSNARPSGRVGSIVQLVISPAPETVGVSGKSTLIVLLTIVKSSGV